MVSQFDLEFVVWRRQLSHIYAWVDPRCKKKHGWPPEILKNVQGTKKTSKFCQESARKRLSAKKNVPTLCEATKTLLTERCAPRKHKMGPRQKTETTNDHENNNTTRDFSDACVFLNVKKILHGNIETYGVPSAQECVRGTLGPDREESHRMLHIVKFQKNEFLDDPCLQKVRRITVTRDGEATKDTRHN